ncbi:hypothetical protein LY71_106136 [Geodermatophilus tzadiensis]|uniref:LPXTG-motif cell wall-anchored protein n=1 Tax=Geodermatophilus tzadiensis TaxID=1137988 RepID=A0A2T0TUM2_9ACTN|nr:hypothetical protein [Geodermatophilus tzadiensis]PRY49359.1 hypothetical protein LY71_106136 [Geodermatophilus tzadiensis]
MYSKAGYATASGIGGSTTLASTGLDTLALVVAGVTLVFAGLALLKLVPRRAKG